MPLIAAIVAWATKLRPQSRRMRLRVVTSLQEHVTPLQQEGADCRRLRESRRALVCSDGLHAATLHEQTAARIRGSDSADRAVRGTRLGDNFVIAASAPATVKICTQQAPPRALAVEVRPHRPNPYISGATDAR